MIMNLYDFRELILYPVGLCDSCFIYVCSYFLEIENFSTLNERKMKNKSSTQKYLIIVVIFVLEI